MQAAIRRGYVDSRWGQLHYREATPREPSEPPLLCLHATAYSGQTFEPVMPLLAQTRRVIALDTPGYGASDGAPAQVAFEAYAEVLAESIARLVGATPVDVLGYHTGALLATEMAASKPQAFRRLVLIGIPYFEGSDKTAWRSRLVHETVLDERYDQFRERWDYFVTHRTEGLSLSRAFACFVDELRAYPRDWWAHAALFDYDAGSRLSSVGHDVLVINPTGALAAASKHAATLMPHARVVALPSLTGAIFDLGSALLAATVDRFLAGDQIVAVAGS